MNSIAELLSKPLESNETGGSHNMKVPPQIANIFRHIIPEGTDTKGVLSRIMLIALAERLETATNADRKKWLDLATQAKSKVRAREPSLEKLMAMRQESCAHEHTAPTGFGSHRACVKCGKQIKGR